jgi:phospholipid transport system substrate-binding protein
VQQAGPGERAGISAHLDATDWGSVSSAVIVLWKLRALDFLKGDAMFRNDPTIGDHRRECSSPARREMPQWVAKYALLLALTLSAPAALAQGLAPDALLRTVTFELIDIIKQDQELKAADPAKVAALVEARIVPLVDFVHMTRLAMARNWRLATPEQQRMLTEEFKTLLVRTYSTALAHYRGEVVNFKQLRAAPLDTEVTVRSEVRQAGKERMILDYEMQKTPAGWKVYDVKLAGVRLVTTYRDVFAEKVRDGGVDGLIKFLAEGNRGGGSRFNTIKASFWEKSRVMYAIFQNMFRGGRQ